MSSLFFGFFMNKFLAGITWADDWSKHSMTSDHFDVKVFEFFHCYWYILWFGDQVAFCDMVSKKWPMGFFSCLSVSTRSSIFPTALPSSAYPFWTVFEFETKLINGSRPTPLLVDRLGWFLLVRDAFSFQIKNSMGCGMSSIQQCIERVSVPKEEKRLIVQKCMIKVKVTMAL